MDMANGGCCGIEEGWSCMDVAVGPGAVPAHYGSAYTGQ